MRFTPLPLLAVGLALSLTLASAPSFAEGPADEAMASVLFKEGRALAEAGNHAAACPKFVEALRLHAATGTALNVGDCFEKTGKLASAWGAFKSAETLARKKGDADRQAEAARRAEALSPRLSKLTIVVPPAARVPGYELKRDGEKMGEGQWGSALPVDTGAHTIEASAPGRKTWSTVVRVDTEGAAASVEAPVLEVEAVKSPPASFWTGQRVAGTVVGGFGLASVLTGAIAGGLAIAKASSAEPHCIVAATETACDATGLALRSDGRTMANVSNVAFALGAAAIIGGIVLFATAPSTGKPTSGLRFQAAPAYGALGATVSVEGAW